MKKVEFKVEIGTQFKDDKRDIIITDRKIMKNKIGQACRYYKYKCNKCGFECGGHYKDGEFKEEYWIVEHSLLKGQGCSCCCNASKIAVSHINSIVAKKETQWMIPYFQGGYDEAKQYIKGSAKKILPICPYCGRIKDKEMKIRTIYSEHSIGCICGDGISYPEKFMFNILEQLNINFETQLTKTTFEWCKDYKYDFYFEYNNIKHIIETHGVQHYKKSNRSKRSFTEEQKNDVLKKELALSNGIKEENYIVIDCRKSDLEWIKNDVLKSRLTELFDLSNVDWLKCEEFALSNLCKKVCEIKRDNPNISVTEICNIIKLSNATIRIYLNKGSKVWDWCNYNGKEEQRKNGIKFGKMHSIEVEIFNKDGTSLGTFPSCRELERQSLELFGVKLNNTNISTVCINKVKQYKGYTFKYI